MKMIIIIIRGFFVIFLINNKSPQSHVTCISMLCYKMQEFSIEIWRGIFRKIRYLIEVNILFGLGKEKEEAKI